MNKKFKLLIFSDCYIYGGSERMMSFLFRNSIILEKYDIFFAYRKHKIYQKGINKEFANWEKIENLLPVLIISNATLFYKINLTRYSLLIKKIIKVPFFLIDIIGIYFIFNLISHIITIKKVSPDIIHINNGGYPGARSCNTMVVAARILRFKCIIYQVNSIARKPTGPFNQFYDRFINRNVSYFITASQNARVKLIKERKFDAGRVKQIPNTVLDEVPSISRNEILNGLAINQSDFILCTVGFLSKRKGHKYLLDALYIISQNKSEIFKKIRLILVGAGEEEQFLKHYVEQYELSKNIFFTGYQPDPINYINACDLFILPSINDEDMPLAVLSAMSKSKTILSTDFAGIREEIENGISGILVSPNLDSLAVDLAAKIIELYNNPNILYGEEAKKRFNNFFSTSVYGNSLLNIYNTAITENN